MNFVVSIIQLKKNLQIIEFRIRRNFVAHVFNITFEQQYVNQQNRHKNFVLCKWKISLNEPSSALSLYNHDRQVRSKRHFPLMNLSVEANKKYCKKKIVHQWTIPTRYRSSNRPLSSLWLKINETSLDYFCWASKFLEKIKRIS